MARDNFDQVSVFVGFVEHRVDVSIEDRPTLSLTDTLTVESGGIVTL